MACARKLILLLLPGLGPLIVRGLQVEPTASSATAASRLSQTDVHHPVPKQKRVLLILAGLTRHMDVTWPALERALVVPNEQAGYTFKTVFTTNASFECHRESAKFHVRNCEEGGADPKKHMRTIKKFFGARDVEVIHDTEVCEPYRPGEHRLSRQSDDDDDLQPDGDDDLGLPQSTRRDSFDSRFPKVPCAPWWERVHNVLAKIVKSGEKFDRVVAMRPDIVLHPATTCKASVACNADPFVEPPHLQLDNMCAKKPGFSFVTPGWKTQGRSYFHERDVDFMHILCAGEELPAYEEAIRVPLAPCSHEPYPPLPTGFVSSKGWHDQALFCRFAQALTDRNVSISHWDDTYTIVWPKPGSFNMSNASV